MNSSFDYVPVIKGKTNDIKAVSFTAPEVASRTKPLFELPPFVETDQAEQVLSRFATRLSKFFGSRPCYIDFPLLKADAATSDGSPALHAAYALLGAAGINYQPVYGFDRSDTHWKFVLDQGRRRDGLLLRLEGDDIEFASDTLDRIHDLTLRGLDIRALDVMLDFRFLADSVSSASSADLTQQFVEQLSTAFNVRRLIVSGSSAPKSVAGIDKNSRGDITRQELSLWAGVRSRQLGLEAVYSDYGVLHPDFTDLTPSPHINGKIRYTQGRHFHVFRGHSLRQDDRYEQYRSLAHSVVQSGYFQGHMFSRGDRYIYDCATGAVNTGNPGTWVMNDINHHCTYAVRQVQRLEALIYRGYPESAVLQQA